ncbi:Bug family tripartite tricarboxylate transporter substrate binding protein [Stutzerimonas azotifigens]|uniref:Bug family tripartite tricarboxylate transporter substrate binding protein n=1 Tax=Stutzerimonas azotifigens TaxID=291995 RepID=UPI000A01C365|nr:tripartite tricarboxylate transporter substrate binding protein [Stutzerimonas azotifigens]
MLRQLCYNLTLAAACLASATIATGVSAEDKWPTREVRVYVPGSPGGPTDLIARTFQPFLEKEVGVPVIVVNQGGGGGIVASNTVLAAKGDGGTLMITHALLHSAKVFGLTEITYKDFAAIGTISEADNVLVARADAPYNTLQELHDYAEANPGKVVIASFFGGMGQTMSDALETWSGDTLRSVDIGTDSDKLTSVLGQQTDLALLAKNTAQQYVDAGQLKVLALLNERPDPQHPDWPLPKSANLDLAVPLVYTLYAPASMPDALQQRLGETLKKIVESDDFAKATARIDQLPVYRDAEATKTHLEREFNFFQKTIKSSGK